MRLSMFVPPSSEKRTLLLREPFTENSLVPRGRQLLLMSPVLLPNAVTPVAGRAYHAGELAFVYLGVLGCAATLLHGRRALNAAEPALSGDVRETFVGRDVIVGGTEYRGIEREPEHT